MSIKNQISFVVSPSVQLNNLEFDSYYHHPPNGNWIKTCSPTLPIAISPSTTATLTCEWTADSSDVRISDINPNQFTPSAGVSIEITGANLTIPAFSLQLGVNAEIPFSSGLTVGQGNTLVSGTVNFSALSPGTYDLIYRDASGHTARQIEAITIR